MLYLMLQIRVIDVSRKGNFAARRHTGPDRADS